jgi:SPASM domain peptide maturase of grasp-with-spasm system
MNDKYFVLFSNCFLVQGKFQSAIYDLGRGTYIPIDNLLYDVLWRSKFLPVEALKAHYKHEYDAGITAYFNLFLEKELGFFTHDRSHFRDMSTDWDSSTSLETAIVEYAGLYNIHDLIHELDKERAMNVQFRLLPGTDISVSHLIECLKQTNFTCVEIYAPYHSEQEIQRMQEQIKETKILSKVVWYAAPESKWLTTKPNQIIYRQEDIKPGQLEIISAESMLVDIELFMESLSYNTALNRKISISYAGAIKNHVSHEQSFGHIERDRISTIYQAEAFREKWHIHKESILDCKDCPYRHACIHHTDLVEDKMVIGIWPIHVD